MLSSNTRTTPRPSRLASLSAKSARRMRSVGSRDSPASVTIKPIDAPPCTVLPSTLNVPEQAFSTRVQSISAAWTPGVSNISPNSSPPSRATMPPAGTLACSTEQILRISSSPARWPSVSLTSLKRSRSTIATAKRESVRARSVSARRNASLLGASVSESWFAIWIARLSFAASSCPCSCNCTTCAASTSRASASSRSPCQRCASALAICVTSATSNGLAM
ncbi:hypothetical protein D9M73_139180 [compost metagenome]